jgi:hypothetical protein
MILLFMERANWISERYRSYKKKYCEGFVFIVKNGTIFYIRREKSRKSNKNHSNLIMVFILNWKIHLWKVSYYFLIF